MELTGTVKLVGEVKKFSDKFSKLQVVVTTEEKYPQDVPVEFVNDKISLAQSLKSGQKVTIGFNLRGSEYKGKYYASIQGWRVSQAEGNDQVQPEEVGEDLPF